VSFEILIFLEARNPNLLNFCSTKVRTFCPQAELLYLIICTYYIIIIQHMYIIISWEGSQQCKTGRCVISQCNRIWFDVYCRNALKSFYKLFRAEIALSKYQFSMEKQKRSVKSEFKEQPGITYFDSAGRSVLPQSVEAVGHTALSEKSKPWEGVGSSNDILEVRKLYAKLIGCDDPGCIAICPSTGFSMTLAARNVVRMGLLTPDKHILLLDKEMGSVVYPWQDACKATGSRLRVVLDPILVTRSSDSDSTITLTDAVLSMIDETVAVVSLPPVHWCNGASIDLVAVSRKIKSMPLGNRPLLIVDGTQSIGAEPFDVLEVDAAFVACSVHKWLNGPYGMSLVYVSPVFHSLWLPLDQHERGREGSEEEGWDSYILMDKITGGYPEAYYPDARKFDAGGKANPVLIPMVREGLQATLDWSPEHVAAMTRQLTDALCGALTQIFGSNCLVIRPKMERCAHILGLRFCRESSFSSLFSLSELKDALARNGVFTAVRGEWLRISPYLHNTLHDVHRFVSIFVFSVSRLAEEGSRILRQHRAPPLHSVSTASTAVDTVTVGVKPKRRVLLTGAAGWLSQFLLYRLLPGVLPSSSTAVCSKDGFTTFRIEEGMELFAGYCTNVPDWVPAERRIQLDLTDISSVRSAVEKIRPDVVIHTAALTAPMQCHKDRHRAEQVTCPLALVDAIKEVSPDCLFVYTSTDMVYDGMHPPYSVLASDSPAPLLGLEPATATSSNAPAAQEAFRADQNSRVFCPVNVYGETKLAFERVVRNNLKHAVVLRLSNMIGTLLNKTYNSSPIVYHVYLTTNCFTLCRAVSQV
jgi:selenocysteine lyase/cysteine desulfurase/dTDP-4-dehydrorhamnose reductase